MFTACLFQGITLLTGAARPASIEAALPPSVRMLWAVLLVVGGTLVLAGLYWPNAITGIEIKRPGLIACGGASLAYSAALLSLGAPGLAAAIWTCSFGLACLVRWRQLTRRVRQLRRDLVEARTRLKG